MRVDGVGMATGKDTQSTARLEALSQISRALATKHVVSDLLRDVLKILEHEFGMTRGTLTLRRPGTDIFAIEASHGLTREERDRGSYKSGEGVTGEVAKSKRSAIIPDISKDETFLGRTGSRRGANVAFLCVPIIHKRSCIGTISIDCPSAPADDLKSSADFLELVADLLAEAVASIREAVAEKDTLVAENRRLRQQLGDRHQIQNMVGNCSAMRAIYEQIAQVANSMATVLIRGESGTGKELVAQALHYGSERRDAAFISVNCAALPENLIESELFGHEKGAFTGAQQQRKGRFELANGGTLFLDEIGDIPPGIQVRLLRVLQERTFERVGGDKTIRTNVRVIAATSRDLETYMEEERFREDLYYRLNVFPIHLPPLRERRSDIVQLADHFLGKYKEIYQKDVKRISTPAINMMMAYHWPGNVRELENCIERAVLTSQDEVVHAYSLPASLQTIEETNTPLMPESGASLKGLVDSFEREVIVDSLKKYRGNASAAARSLQTTKRILNYKIQKLGVDARNYK